VILGTYYIFLSYNKSKEKGIDTDICTTNREEKGQRK
jgi:hypothetical protein